ncbi:helix-turn-helix domain-containing protein [Roseateles sp.]|uniref:helix-turn-helix domain-containing protein n=1 Tax=Roseateles sp. TaxID=1971397 RepID=UPI0039C8CC54
MTPIESNANAPRARLAARADSFDPVVASACGAVLRSWRLDRGVAQDAFALAAGIDRSYYGKLERGERQPSLSVLLKCAGALSVPAATLVGAIESSLRQSRQGTE